MRLAQVALHLVASLLALSSFFPHLALAFTSYPDDFVNPNYVLARRYPGNTGGAQFSILKWADFLAPQGPWSEFQFASCILRFFFLIVDGIDSCH